MVEIRVVVPDASGVLRLLRCLAGLLERSSTSLTEQVVRQSVSQRALPFASKGVAEPLFHQQDEF